MRERQKAWIERWKSPSDIEKTFSPDNWNYASGNPERSYNADCPTLASYENLYGEGVSADWIEIQVLALYGSSGNKDKAIADGIEIFSNSFATQVKAYKLSELMLFFSRYKAGKYDNSFATFDSRRIGNAFFKEFLPERNCELDRINRKKTLEDIESRRFIPPEGYNSLTWYKKVREAAENGEEWAIKELTHENHNPLENRRP